MAVFNGNKTHFRKHLTPYGLPGVRHLLVLAEGAIPT